MRKLRILTVIFLIELISFYIGGLYIYYMIFYSVFALVGVAAFFVFKRRFKKDNRTPINLEELKYKKDIQIYIISRSSPAAYITYRTKGINIFISQKLYKILTRKELEVIVYHELGHYYYRYISFLGDIIIFAIVITLPIVMHYFYNKIDTLFITYGIFIIYSFLILFFYSNFRKILEILADKQSIKYTSRQRFVRVLIKSAKAFNKEKSSNAIYNAFFEFHPPVKIRCLISYRQ